MEHTKRCLKILLASWLLAGAGPALAQERTPAKPGRIAVGPGAPARASGSMADTMILECNGNRGLFRIGVNPGRLTTFHFATPVLNATNPAPRDLDMKYGAATVTVQPRRNRRGYQGNLLVYTRACDANIDLWITDRAEDAPLTVDVRQRDVVAEELARIHAAEAEQKAELAREKHALAEERAALEREKERTTDSLATKLLLHDHPLMPVVRKTRREGDPILVKLGAGRWLGDGYYFPIELENPHAQPFSPADLQVFDAAGTRIDAKVLGMEGAGGDHGGLVEMLQPKQHVKGVIKLPRSVERSISPLTVQITARNGLQPVLVAVDDWEIEIGPPMWPVTREEKQRREREKRRLEREEQREKLRQEREDREWERRAREEKEKDRVTLHLMAVAGGIWLPDGLGQGRLDPTSLTGFGARVTYGFNRFLGFEAEVIGAGTGEARFGDTGLNGMQGDLLRSASLGRVQAGPVVRFGRKTVPFMRIGVGAQGASIGSRFLVGGNEAPGPDSAFDFDGLWYFGGGVDFRIGEHFVAGFGAAFEQMANSGVRSIEAGIHVGYGWKP